ncbi:hypothetical protein EEDFHM_04075 [Methylorubrum populi]
MTEFARRFEVKYLLEVMFEDELVEEAAREMAAMRMDPDKDLSWPLIDILVNMQDKVAAAVRFKSSRYDQGEGVFILNTEITELNVSGESEPAE